MSIGSLHNDQVTGLDALSGSIAIDSLTGILEAHFKKLIELLLIDTMKPVIHLELTTALTIVAFNLARLASLYSTSS
jgi:hypothetical protein